MRLDRLELARRRVLEHRLAAVLPEEGEDLDRWFVFLGLFRVDKAVGPGRELLVLPRLRVDVAEPKGPGADDVGLRDLLTVAEQMQFTTAEEVAVLHRLDRLSGVTLEDGRSGFRVVDHLDAGRVQKFGVRRDDD